MMMTLLLGGIGIAVFMMGWYAALARSRPVTSRNAPTPIYSVKGEAANEVVYSERAEVCPDCGGTGTIPLSDDPDYFTDCGCVGRD